MLKCQEVRAAFLLLAIGGQAYSQSENSQVLAIVSAASFTEPVARDSLATIFGTRLARSTVQAAFDSNGRLPAALDGTSVEVNGIPAALVYVSPTQVNFVVPAEIAPGPSEVVVTSSATGYASRGSVYVGPAAAGLFTIDDRGTGAVLNALTYARGPFPIQTPELPGIDKRTRLAVFATGIRGVAEAPAQSAQHVQSLRIEPARRNAGRRPAMGLAVGDPRPDSVVAGRLLPGPEHALPASETTRRVGASVAGVNAQLRTATGMIWAAEVEYAGPAPGFAGLDQINIVLPAEAAGVDRVELQVTAGGMTSNRITIPLVVIDPACPQPPVCADISGDWDVDENGSLTCTASVGTESETDTDPIGGTGTVRVQKTGSCSYRWDPAAGHPELEGVIGTDRKASVKGNDVEFSGIAAVPAEGAVLTRNEFKGSGRACGDRMTLSGDSEIEGTAPGDGGVTVRIVCRGQSTAQMRRKLPGIRITEIWSDQFSGSRTNLLPNGAGWMSNLKSYVLMGARPDGSIHTKARYEIQTTDPEVMQWARERLLVRMAFRPGIGSVLAALGTGQIAGDTAEMSVDRLSDAVADLIVIAWLDLDGNGKLDKGEPYTTGDGFFRVVTVSAYDAAVQNGTRLSWYGRGFRGADALLKAFLDGTAPGGIGNFREGSARLAQLPGQILGLAHNVGLEDGSPGIPTYTFDKDSVLAEELRTSNQMRRLLLSVLEDMKADVVRAFDGAGAEPGPFTRQIGQLEIAFGAASDFPVFLTYGTAVIRGGTITATVRRTGTTLELTSAHVICVLADVYHWKYEIGLDRGMAQVQAGFDSLGRAGRVFGVEVEMDYIDTAVKFKFR